MYAAVITKKVVPIGSQVTVTGPENMIIFEYTGISFDSRHKALQETARGIYEHLRSAVDNQQVLLSYDQPNNWCGLNNMPQNPLGEVH